MKQRYQRDIRLDIKATTTIGHVPPAILHTVLENAFSHNKIKNGDRFTLELQNDKDRLHIRFITPFRNTQHAGTGTGEQYIRARLSEQFERNWRFTGGPIDERNWQTQFDLPLIQAKPRQLSRSTNQTETI